MPVQECPSHVKAQGIGLLDSCGRDLMNTIPDLQNSTLLSSNTIFSTCKSIKMARDKLPFRV
jgi:hypothetical protein